MATETRERLYPRTEAQIKADIAEARARLAASIEQLAKEAQPKTLKNNAVDQVKAMADAQYQSVKGQFVDENGVRLDRVGMIAGSVAGVVATMLTLRGIYRGGQRRKVRRVARKQAAAIAAGPVKITVKRS
ncbi:Protein of unknown function [Raineyella antarctica]|uniref:DUF3618 domain-containing protein n=1 Tax=Raineyella antarctica TaxID=1577474 RepID=A0A1G6H3W6_9ACTN|nr:DUF3618 domain-containing protein [Raineyella antarctica]SDB88844.1 Protein of unknown function [Raineyella antarctica]